MLMRSIYCSVPSHDLSADDYRAILKSAWANNKVNEITGLLIGHSEWFLQLLEGDKTDVDALIAKIMTDRRHTHIHFFGSETEVERLFPNWDMGYVTESRGLDELAQSHEMDSITSLRTKDVTEVRGFLQAVADKIAVER